jgi:hypothetical protein
VVVVVVEVVEVVDVVVVVEEVVVVVVVEVDVVVVEVVFTQAPFEHMYPNSLGQSMVRPLQRLGLYGSGHRS